MIVLGIDPGPITSGVVVYDSEARRVLYASKAATAVGLEDGARYAGRETTPDGRVTVGPRRIDVVLIERPACMGPLGAGKVGHMLDTAWAAGGLERRWLHTGHRVHTMTRREVLRDLGVLSGKGSADSRVRAACIADHGGSKTVAVGTKKAPGPLYGVSSHAWQALGLVLAWLETHTEDGR